MKKAFTLIELLVVVLIIGILSAIALPQYTKAVEKARVAEVLSNVKAIENSIDIYLMENGGYPSSSVWFKNMGTVTDLAGGEWEDTNFLTNHFDYSAFCYSEGCSGEIYRSPNYDYAFWIHKGKLNRTDFIDDGLWHNECITESTDIGRYICKSLESLGWEYVDGDM